MVPFVVKLIDEGGGVMVPLVVTLIGKGGVARARADGRMMKKKVKVCRLNFIVTVVKVVKWLKVVKNGKISLRVGEQGSRVSVKSRAPLPKRIHRKGRKGYYMLIMSWLCHPLSTFVDTRTEGIFFCLFDDN